MSPTPPFGLDQSRTANADRLRHAVSPAFDLALDAIAWIWRCSCRIRQRQALRNLDDHLLADIGISRAAAIREAEKRFWQ
ncbi:DUF1127 domain-containing protein [Desertibaculum subflavum]|uniref:DUF1127 domain-containing protein n=1 Tax=Desertibaculum subflavum TaxID=2268458 RepID=UPI000E66C730